MHGKGDRMAFRKLKLRWPVLGILTAFLLLMAFNLTEGATDQEVSAIRSAIKAKGAQWVAGETSILRLPPAERKKRLGLLKFKDQNQETGDFFFRPTPPPPSPPPPSPTPQVSLDWRNFPGNATLPPGNYVTKVRDQGACGSCWAFAPAAALESNVLIAEKTPGTELNFSEQVLVSCSGAGDCDGGFIGLASDYIRDYGLPVESCFPYLASKSACTPCGTYQTLTWAIASWHYETTFSATVTAIKNALSTYGPLVTTMEVYSDFYGYSSGIYSHVTGTYQGGHSILIVGYNDTQQYFIAKNSWGTGWGEAGFFRIAYSQLASLVKFGRYTISYEPEGSSPPPPPTPSCSYSLSPTSQSFNSFGGSGTVSVTTQSGCSWTAKSNVSWITINSGASGTGSGTVTFAVAANTAALTRTGTMTIAGKTFTVNQTGLGGWR